MEDDKKTTARPLADVIAEAREMQMNGQYIRGAVFHAMAEEIDRLRADLAEMQARYDADMSGAAHNAALDRAEIEHWKEQTNG